MARFLFPLAVVAVVALYANQVFAQDGVVAVNASDAPACYEPDASDCVGKPEVKDCKYNLCCSGLKYGAADNGTTWALGSGTCTCCRKGFCLTQYSAAQGSTPNTESDAQALNVQCKLPGK